MTKRILVTGGAGFIGSSLVDRLLEDKQRVVVLDNFNDYYSPAAKNQNLKEARKNKKFELVRGDIRSEKILDSVLGKTKFDVVVHLAARAGVRPSFKQPRLYWDVNVRGTLNVLESMRQNKCNQLVFASSSSVYGERDVGPFRETDVTDYPVSVYGSTKKAIELMCFSYSKLHQIKTTGLRFFTAFGPRNRPDMACYKFVDAISKAKSLTKFGDGSTGRDYTYIDDVVEGIVRAVERPFEFEVINLGNSSPVLLNDLIATIEIVVGKKARARKGKIQQGDVGLTFADIGKAKKMLGWQPKVKFEEGIRRLAEWYGENAKSKAQRVK